MNVVKCISGLRQEGKSTELLEDYLRVNKLYGINAVFIKCEQPSNSKHTGITKLNEDIMKLDKLDSLSEITFDKYKLVAVYNEQLLMDTIHSHVAEYDCVLFIDDPHVICTDFTTIVEKIVDETPNEECGNSVDITYTRLRNKQ